MSQTSSQGETDDKGLEFTITPCSTCGKTSTENEGMVCCSICKHWHQVCRCDGCREKEEDMVMLQRGLPGEGQKEQEP